MYLIQRKSLDAPVVIVGPHSGLAGREYENERTTSIGDSEMEGLVREYFPELLFMRQIRINYNI